MKSIERTIQVRDERLTVSLNQPVRRWQGNPVLSPSKVNAVWTAPEMQVITAHNAGVTRFDGKFIMLFRSHLRNGISVIGKARSQDGITWKVEKKPAMVPDNKDDAGGVEDPRITKIDDTFYITYSAYHGLEKDRVRVSLATTKDFNRFEKHGSLLDVDMRNVVIFHEKINGKYYALFRPNDHTKDHTGGIFKQILIGHTGQIENQKWNIDNRPIMQQAGGPSSFGDKIGPGAPPIKTRHGWINIFHGVRSTMDGNPYVLGVALHDCDDLERLKVSNIPILFPSEADCVVSVNEYIHVPHVVFTCGAVRNDDGSIFIYYGGNDTVMNLGVTHEDILAELCNQFPQNPLTGRPEYELKVEG